MTVAALKSKTFPAFTLIVVCHWLVYYLCCVKLKKKPVFTVQISKYLLPLRFKGKAD
jgi:hypothetical protein